MADGAVMAPRHLVHCVSREAVRGTKLMWATASRPTFLRLKLPLFGREQKRVHSCEKVGYKFGCQFFKVLLHCKQILLLFEV